MSANQACFPVAAVARVLGVSRAGFYAWRHRPSSCHAELLNEELATTLMSVCIVAAQAVMVPVAMVTGAKADAWGRKPIFLVALTVLALRGALYPLSDNPCWLVGVQLLDGVGAGIFGALFPLIVADLTRGTGRFNVSQGAIATAQGIGAALSAGVAGVIVVSAGYSAAFLLLAGVAGAGLLLFWFAMPETLGATRSRASHSLWQRRIGQH